MGQNTHFFQMNFVEEIFLSLESQSGENLGKERIQGRPFFPFPSLQFQGKASQI